MVLLIGDEMSTLNLSTIRFTCIALNALPCRVVLPSSFSIDAISLYDLPVVLSTLCSKVRKKLRQKKSCANLNTVFIHTNRFSENDRQYYNSKTVALPVATNSDIKLIHYANIALKAIYRDGYFYKKSGVIVSEIVPENQVQLDLLDTVDRDKHARLMGVIDGLTDRFGRSKVRVLRRVLIIHGSLRASSSRHVISPELMKFRRCM